MKVSVYNRQKDVSISKKSVTKSVKSILEFHQLTCDEMAVHFITDIKMRKLHAEYFNDPSPTDCITFPIDRDASSGYFFLGEVLICPRTALNYIDVNGGELYNEITLYMVHGILHLLGYDDIEKRDQKIMRTKEKELMDHLANNQLFLTATN